MTESGQVGEETKTSVTLVVTDVNDELPEFNRAAVTVPVPEDVGTDTPLPGLSLEVGSLSYIMLTAASLI